MSSSSHPDQRILPFTANKMNRLELRLKRDNLTCNRHKQPQGAATEKTLVDHVRRDLTGEGTRRRKEKETNY